MKYLSLCLVVLAGCQQNPAPEATKKDTPAPAAEAKFQWPEDARYAVVSDDGKTVAFSTAFDVVVVREGHELSRLQISMKDPHATLNKDGSRLAAYSLSRKGIVVWDTESGTEVGFISRRGNMGTFEFSPGGTFLATFVLDKVEIYHAINGQPHVVLHPYDGSMVSRFYFANAGNSDKDLTINLVDRDVQDRVTQWSYDGSNHWNMAGQQRVWASEDQAYDPWIKSDL